MTETMAAGGVAAGEKAGADPKDPIAVDRALEPWTIADDDTRWEKITEDGGIMKLKVRDPDEDDAPKPEDGQKVMCHYTGFLRKDGTFFDSSRERGKEFDFEIGQGAVIKGWDQGLATMQIGEKAILRCTSEYAYGDSGSPPSIPGGATLDFVIELKDIKCYEPIWDIDDASESIAKKVIKKPEEGWETPKEEGKVVVTVTGTAGKKGPVFLELKEEEVYIPYDLEFKHKGTSNDYPYHRGFYHCLRNCIPGGTFGFECKSTEFYTYGATGCKTSKVGPNTDLYYTITLHSMDGPKSIYSLDAKEKLPWAKTRKAKASEYFRAKKIEVAKKLYTDMVDTVENLNEKDLSEEENKEKKEMCVALRSNIALIESQLGNLSEAMEQVDKGLVIDSSHVKLLYRKAQILAKLTKFDEAMTVLTDLVEKNPDNKAAVSLQSKIKILQKNAAKKQRKLAKKMFAGFGKKSAKTADEKPKEEAGVLEEEAAEDKPK